MVCVPAGSALVLMEAVGIPEEALTPTGLPRLLPSDAEARRAFVNLVEATLPKIGKLNVEGQRRLNKVLQLLGADIVVQGKTGIAAE